MASCNIVDKLKVEVDDLTERVRVLSTALRLYSFAGAGPPGPEGPAGPEGLQVHVDFLVRFSSQALISILSAA